MIDIDFLPARYREQRANRRKRVWRLGVIVAYAALLGVAALSGRAQRGSLAKEIAQARERHAVVIGQQQQLTALQSELTAARWQAELITYLRHPWPRTAVLAAVIRPLPATIVLEDVRIFRAAGSATPVAPLRDVTPAAGDASATDTRIPAQKDLEQLRQLVDEQPMQVALSGTAEENSALHEYLGDLSKAGLFCKVELVSIEAGEGAGKTSSRFSAKLTIAPGYGQPRGPSPTDPSDVALRTRR
jgi:Fimbrial assembly protein (PilN)